MNRIFFWICLWFPFLVACKSNEDTDSLSTLTLCSPTEIEVPMSGGTLQIDYDLGKDAHPEDLQVVLSADWLSLVHLPTEDHLVLLVSENTFGSDRMAALTLSYGKDQVAVIIKQSGEPESPRLTIVSEKNLSLDRVGQWVEVRYTLENENSEDYVYAKKDADWIYEIKMTEAGSVTLGIATNTTGSTRSSRVILGYGKASDSLLIHQSGDGEINFHALRAQGSYYGDQYAPGTSGNYWVIFSDRGFKEDGSSHSHATYYRIDAYGSIADHAASLVELPQGLYVFDPENTMAPWTFSAEFSGYWVTDERGSRDWIQPIEAGEMRVDADQVTLTLTIAGEEHTVIYDGNPKLEDASGDIRVYSTLEGDYEADLSNHQMICECYGDYYEFGYTNWMFLIQPKDDHSGDCFQVDFITEYTDEASGFCGEYVSSDYLATNAFIPGWTDGTQMLCSWFFTTDRSAVAPFRGGTMSITDLGDGRVTVVLDVYDDLRHRITGTWTGTPEIL